MSPTDRIQLARRRLARSRALAALLWAVAAVLLVIVLAAATDAVIPLGARGRDLILPLAGLAALVAALVAFLRGRAADSLSHAVIVCVSLAAILAILQPRELLRTAVAAVTGAPPTALGDAREPGVED